MPAQCWGPLIGSKVISHRYWYCQWLLGVYIATIVVSRHSLYYPEQQLQIQPAPVVNLHSLAYTGLLSALA